MMTVSLQSARNHRRAAEEYKLEKDKAASVEDELNKTLSMLKKQIKEATKVQVLYEVGISCREVVLLLQRGWVCLVERLTERLGISCRGAVPFLQRGW